MPSKPSGLALAAAVLFAGAALLPAQVDELRLLPIEDPVLNYSHGPVQDRVVQLQQKIDKGEIRLGHHQDRGYLEAVLDALKVPVSSQILVFSKTSFQAPKIGPRMPRAIYHSDDTMVGFVRGGDVLEIASVDPAQGVVFYTLDQGDLRRPVFERRGECVQCHLGSSTLGVPGLVVRSLHVDRSGAQILSAKAYVTDHRSPLEHRWGGWYVTGKSGSQEHMGNQFAESRSAPDFDLADGTNVTDLGSYFDTGAYLRPDSDIVSLMVLEHQTRMVNLLTRLGWETRLAAGKGSDFSSIGPTVEEVVKYMLFADETPLHGAVEGGSAYAQEFGKQGPRDHQGRSLRDFDLKTRMFRYPCSFLIYSAQFDALPAPARDRVYRRLHEVLTGGDRSPAYARLTAADRQAILEILLDTKSGLPAGWKAPRR